MVLSLICCRGGFAYVVFCLGYECDHGGAEPPARTCHAPNLP